MTLFVLDLITQALFWAQLQLADSIVEIVLSKLVQLVTCHEYFSELKLSKTNIRRKQGRKTLSNLVINPRGTHQ
ncbi:hypothetical protein M2263_002787 [Providencia alcalifaciens]|nr:hypothetical protein [Providencia alcalifaciens]